MTQIGKLTIGSLNNNQGQNIAIEEIVARLNQLIVDHNNLDNEVSTGGAQGPMGPAGANGPKGDAGPGYSRQQATLITGSLAPGVTERGSFNLMERGDLLYITPDKACRVIYYTDLAAQTADIGRSLGTPAPTGVGILCEFSFNHAYQIDASPIPRVTNKGVAQTGIIYYAVTNRSLVTGTITLIHRIDRVPLS